MKISMRYIELTRYMLLARAILSNGNYYLTASEHFIRFSCHSSGGGKARDNCEAAVNCAAPIRGLEIFSIFSSHA